MKKSYESGLAIHIGESCGAARKSGVEALTGERAGRVFSRVRTFLRDADAVKGSGKLRLVEGVVSNHDPYSDSRFCRRSLFVAARTEERFLASLGMATQKKGDDTKN